MEFHDWRRKTFLGTCCSVLPAVVDGFVYVGSLDGKVYCLNALNGEQIWNYTTGSWVQSSPAIANGHVYIGLMMRTFTALTSARQKI